MTLLQVVQQAVNQCNSLAPGDVVKQLILTGYNPLPVNDVFRALETIQSGTQYDSNNRKVRAGLKLTPHADPAHEMNMIIEKQRRYNQRKRELGECRCCKENVYLSHVYCKYHLEKERINSKNYYRNNGRDPKKKVKEAN